jgi:hypothetical protein
LLSTAARAQSPAQTEFSQLKSLAGSWEGKTSQGAPVKIDYQLTSGGSALMSTIHEHGGMISMIHMDGPDKLLLTHYCSMRNHHEWLPVHRPTERPSRQVSGCHESPKF